MPVNSLYYARRTVKVYRRADLSDIVKADVLFCVSGSECLFLDLRAYEKTEMTERSVHPDKIVPEL